MLYVKLLYISAAVEVKLYHITTNLVVCKVHMTLHYFSNLHLLYSFSLAVLRGAFGVFFYFLICFCSFRIPLILHFLLSSYSLLHVCTLLFLFYLLPNLPEAIDIYDFQLSYCNCSNVFPLSLRFVFSGFLHVEKGMCLSGMILSKPHLPWELAPTPISFIIQSLQIPCYLNSGLWYKPSTGISCLFLSLHINWGLQ